MTSVLTALGAKWDGHLVSRLESVPGMTIARRCADLPDLVATAASGVGEVAFVGSDLRGLTLSEVARLRDSGVEVIGVVEPGDEASERRLWQLGVATVVPADTDGPTLAAAVVQYAVPRGAPGGVIEVVHGDRVTSGVARQASSREGEVPAQRSARGRVIAVWGPTGAPGRTSVAVNLAAELAAMGREVLLIDADTYGGSVAQTLSILDEAPGVAAAARAADQGALDLVALSRLALVVTGTFRVLTGIPVASRWPEIRGAALERVVDVARWLVDDVVIDCGFSVEHDE
ncbi:MAG TPA: P-loop NTPase, partial [Dermatophilaceae bacterium]|nr:P-loop NTPase [Dermatophilaceae bacterium]